MPNSLAQIITDAKTAGWYDHILMPDGSLHPNDERAMLEGCYFDVIEAMKVMRFFVTLLEIKWDVGTELNEWERAWISYFMPSFNLDQRRSTKPFVLMRWWYERVLSRLFGWKRADGRRRHDKGFMTTAKKSGKSSTLSGLPLYMILADGEAEAEAYATATQLGQAEIIFNKTNLMGCSRRAKLSGTLRSVPSERRILVDDTGSAFQALASDADGVEGKNPHLLIADELHVWKDRQFFDALMYGDIARAQPLFLMITTAGENLQSVGFEEYEFACDLIDPNSDVYSMSHFAHISEAGRDASTGEVAEKPDDEEWNFDWTNEEEWKRANPALLEGVGSIEKLRAKCNEAKETPAKKRSFIRYICNRWVAGGNDVWLNYGHWKECEDESLEIPEGHEVFCGFDFASVEDLVALAKVWWIDHGTMGLEVDLFMPEEGVDEKEQRWKVPLRDWIDRGFIQTTSGRTIDHAEIRWHISGVALDAAGAELKERNENSVDERFSIAEFAFDRAHTKDLVITQLGQYDGLPVAEFGQGFLSMSAPSKEFKKRVADGTIRHAPNPVLDWMVGHCVVDTDPAGSIKPNKKKSRQKIDGIVASIMAVGISMGHEPEAPSVYEERGVLSF
ncbi:MAG: terminase TerL endonuclease subunit [Planctomycetota bacterium]